MKAKAINRDRVCAKLLALSIIYEKEEGVRQVFLKRMSYSPEEMKAVMDEVCDFGFRSWIETAIPMMQCKAVC
jgi:hypothetical protein